MLGLSREKVLALIDVGIEFPGLDEWVTLEAVTSGCHRFDGEPSGWPTFNLSLPPIRSSRAANARVTPPKKVG